MEFVTERLANLASQLMQERYIANATKDEYLLPEEVLEDACWVLRLVESGSPIVASLSAEAKAEILALAPLLEQEAAQGVVESCTSPQALLENPVWCSLRRQAAACLEALQFDLPAWERRQ
jgi:hypothetical protein